MSEISSSAEKVPFFGGDGRGELFSNVFNQLATDQTQLGSFETDLMFAKHYENKLPGMDNTDIHYEFTDFIITTALYHRSIDRSSTPTEPFLGIKLAFDRNAEKLFNDPVVGGKLLGKFDINKSVVNTQGDTINNNANITNQLDGLIAYFVTFADNIRDTVSVQAESRALSELLGNRKYEFNSQVYDANSKTYNDVIFTADANQLLQNIISVCDTDKNAIPSAILCYMLGNGQYNLDPTPIQTIEKLQLSNINTKVIFDKFMKNVDKCVIPYLDMFFGEIVYTTLGQNKPDKNELVNRFHKKYFSDIAIMISALMFTAFKDALSEAVSVPHETLDNQLAKDLWDAVYAKWNNISYESQRFYKTYLTIMKKIDTKWVVLDEEDYIQKAEEVASNPGSYRFNLTKVIDPRCNSEMASVPKFSFVIPYLDEQVISVVKKIWYTDNNGAIKFISAPLASDFLRHIYNSVYLGVADQTIESMNLPKIFDPDRRLKQFNLRLADLVRLRLTQIKNSPPEIISLGADIENYDKYIQRDQWKRYSINKGDKETQEYTMLCTGKDENQWCADEAFDVAPKGVRVFDASNNCYSTMAVKVTDAESRKECHNYVFNCLLSNDKKGLIGCLRTLEKAGGLLDDDIAKKEINKMHPMIARRTLQRFGFVEREQYDTVAKMKLIKVCDTEYWLKNVVASNITSGEVRNIITNNQSLLRYFDLVVAYVNGNPAILNKNYKGITEETLKQSNVEHFPSKYDHLPPTQYTSATPAQEISQMRRYMATNLARASFTKVDETNRIPPFLTMNDALTMGLYKVVPSFKRNNPQGVATTTSIYDKPAVGGTITTQQIPPFMIQQSATASSQPSKITTSTYFSKPTFIPPTIVKTQPVASLATIPYKQPDNLPPFMTQQTPFIHNIAQPTNINMQSSSTKPTFTPINIPLTKERVRHTPTQMPIIIKPPFMNQDIVLHGGDNLATSDEATTTEDYIKKDIPGRIVGSAAIESLLARVIKRLQASGKILEKTNIDQIDEKINKMRNIENDLIKTIKYIEEYSDLINKMKDYKKEIVSIDTLKQFVDKYNKLMHSYTNRQISMTKIIEAIENLIADPSTQMFTESRRIDMRQPDS